MSLFLYFLIFPGNPPRHGGNLDKARPAAQWRYPQIPAGKTQGAVEEEQKNIVFLLILLQNLLALLRQAKKRAVLPDEPLFLERLHHAMDTGARYAQHCGELHSPGPAVFSAEPGQGEEIAQPRSRKHHGFCGVFCALLAPQQMALFGQFEHPQAH